MPQDCIAWLFLLVSSFLRLLIMACAQQSTTQQTAHVLLLFKQSITKDPYGAFRSWVQPSVQEPNTSSSPYFCNWFGITCDPQSPSSVISIALTGCKLEGSLPFSIGNIGSLILLDLSMNRFSGFVPHSLGMLSSLKTLNLSTNGFVGSIPTSLGNCSSLVLLNISNNSLSGAIPSQLGGLSRLRGLILPNNLLAGGLPSSIFNASALEFLDLSNNRMTGQVPDALGCSKTLLSLKLASNNLTGHIPGSVNAMMSLRGLDISNNMLAGEIPSQLVACTSLVIVILSYNFLGGIVPTRFGEMQNLRVLRLDNNLLSGPMPSSLGNCKHLEDLILSHNMLNGTIPISVASLSSLQISFDLSHNLLTGPIPSQLGGMYRVLNINLAHNMLSGNIVNELVGCTRLEFLDLSSNHLTGFIPDLLGYLLSLKWMLNLSHNSLEGPIPDLQHLQYLRVLDFSDNELSGTVPLSLINLHGLMFFNLSFNRLIGCVPQAETFVSKHVISSWVQANPRSCVPLLSPSCGLPVCNTYVAWYAHLPWYTWLLLSIAVSVSLGVGIFFCAADRLESTSWITTNDEFPAISPRGFSADDLRRAIYSVETVLIGSGASSDVYKVRLGDGQLFAVKCFKPTARQQLFDTELDVLSKLRHRNVVPIKACWKWDRAIALEYMVNGSLKKQLHEMPRCILDLETRIRIATDIAEGLLYLHSDDISIIHGDLKPGNILLDKHLTAYLADFGLATYTVGGLSNLWSSEKSGLPSTFFRFRGTAGYMAPEYGRFKTTPSKAGDVYSYGVVLLELLTGREPSHGDFPPGVYSLPAFVLSAILNGSFNSVLDASLRAHMRSRCDYEKVALLTSVGLHCTRENYVERPSMEVVISFLKHHPTFNGKNLVGFTGDASEDGLTSRQFASATELQEVNAAIGAQPNIRRETSVVIRESYVSHMHTSQTQTQDKGKKILEELPIAKKRKLSPYGRSAPGETSQATPLTLYSSLPQHHTDTLETFSHAT